MTRALEMEVKFEGDWTYRIRFDGDDSFPKIWIDTGCGQTQSMCFDDFDRIIAEYERFKKLSAQANQGEAA